MSLFIIYTDAVIIASIRDAACKWQEVNATIKIIKNGLTLHTSGLPGTNGHELRATVSQHRQLAGCANFLCYAIERITIKHRLIEPDDPIRYGY